MWIALDSETKAVLAYHVGTRDGLSGYEFVQDLGDRIKEQHRFQFTSDGHEVYPPAIEERFGADIDFAQLIKNYARTDGPDWFRPSARVPPLPNLSAAVRNSLASRPATSSGPT